MPDTHSSAKQNKNKNGNASKKGAAASRKSTAVSSKAGHNGNGKGSRRGSKAAERRRIQQRNARIKDVILITIIGIAVLFTVSCFTGESLGWLKNFSYRIFGIMMYVMPALIAVLTGLILFGDVNGRFIRKLLAGLLCLFAFQGILSVTLETGDGGLLGRLNYRIFNQFLGIVGTYVVDVLLIGIGVILFTDYSLLDVVISHDPKENAAKKQAVSERKKKLADEKHELLREEASKKREYRQKEDLRRKEQKNREISMRIAEQERQEKIRSSSYEPVTGIGDTKILSEADSSETRFLRKPGMETAVRRDTESLKAEPVGSPDEDILGNEALEIVDEDTSRIHVPSELFKKNISAGRTEKDETDDIVINLNIPEENSTALRAGAGTQVRAEKAGGTDILTGRAFDDEKAEDTDSEPLFPDAGYLDDLEERISKKPAEKKINSGRRETEIVKTAVPAAKEDAEKAAREKEADRAAAEKLQSEMTANMQKEPLKEYTFPPMDKLTRGNASSQSKSDLELELKNNARKLAETLKTFGVDVKITNISCGPAVTRYEIQPAMGVKVSRIVSLTDDIKLNLAAADIRMEAPIPGKSAIGIEVPNKVKQTVALRDILESREFNGARSKLAFGAGRDIEGNTIVADISKMPHVLVAGATGSGKSVCINSIIMSILYHAKPTEVKMIMIDPKVVELSVYNGIPHLLMPVVTDPKKAAAALNWAVAEMERRYQCFADYSVRSFEGYNQFIENQENLGDPILDENGEPMRKMPQILIIVDELADLMMVASNEVEDAICRLAQKARAAGLHLVLATQRPSVDVITGLIKANIPSRIAFAVSSGVDSRTILDMNGAEKLLGMGDMLYYPAGASKPIRVQGAFVSDGDVKKVVDHIVEEGPVEGISDASGIDLSAVASASGSGSMGADYDEYFAESGRLVIDKEKASIGMLQRAFKLGFNRAARIMDQLASAGVVGEEEGTKPRRVLMGYSEFEEFLKENGLG